MSDYTLSLGGKTNIELGFDVIKENSLLPVMPGTEDYLTDVGGRHGAYYFGADLQPRRFMLNCYFPAALTPAEIEAAIKVLNAHLFDNWGRPAALALFFSWATDRQYTVRYAGRPEVDLTMAMNRRRFILPLVAFDPLAYGEQQEVVFDITDSPEEFWYDVTSGLNAPLTVILDNEGLNTIAGFTFKTFEDILDWEA